MRSLRWLLWVIPAAVLLVFFFYPLAAVLSLGFDAAQTQAEFPHLNFSYLWRTLSFTFWQAGLSTLLTLLVGLLPAYVFMRYKFWGKKLLLALTTIPFILPTVVVAAGFNALLGPRGWANLLLMALFNLPTPPVQIMNTLWAILLAHIFYNCAIVIRTVGSAWAQLNPRYEMAGRVLGASSWRTFIEITLPLLRPAILSAALLVFLFDFTSFGVILILGGPQYTTLEVEIYIQTLQMLNLPVASMLSMVQITCTILLTYLFTRFNKNQSARLIPQITAREAIAPRRWREKALVYLTVFFLLILFATPLLSLMLRSITRLEANRAGQAIDAPSLTLSFYEALWINQRQSIFYVAPADAIRNSLVIASLTACFSTTIGLLIASALSKPSRVNRWIEPVVMLPLGVSAVTLGLGYILVFNRPPFDMRSFPLLTPIAHSLVALPVVTQIVRPALASIPTSLKQAAAMLGATPFKVWIEVDLPIIGRATLAGAIFSFTISLGEFGATSFLTRPEYPTLPVAIYRFLSQPGASNYGQAMAMSTILMLVCGAGIILIDRLR